MASYHEKAVHAWTKESVRLIATPSLLAKSTYFYVQEVGQFQTLEKYYTERKNLNSYLVVYTISGKGHLTYKGKSYTLLPNQVFFIDCMDYQYYETDKQELWEILWVHFNGSSIRGYYEQYALKNNPVVTLEKDTKIPFIIRSIMDTHIQKSIQTELICSKLLVELLTELILSIQDIKLSISDMPGFIQEMINLLDKNFNKKITLDDLSNHFLISKYHLAKEFKRYTGFSPNEYLINNRITYAKELLKYSELTINEIAQNVGVDNSSHFINLFKNRVDLTPFAYRKKWQRPKNK